ncbi:MAG: hypothetical protein V4484_21380 [Pseudomonadota bacterium]
MKTHVCGRRFLLTVIAAFIAASPVSATECSMSTIVGTYGVVLQGHFMPGNSAGHSTTAGTRLIAGSGTMQFNADGSIVRALTVSIDGQIESPTHSGTYVINQDCTGEALINVPFGVESWKFAVVGRGNAILFVNGTTGIVVSGRMERQ